MAKVTKEVNRAIIVLVAGLIATSWVMVNAGTLISSALIFIVLGIISIFLLFNWDKIRRFGS